ncbi:MAG: UDP binding domain-containing protein, partial [Candidatus Hydrothermia bacterium]
LKGSKILVVGVAYKPDIGDTRESPALDVIKLLMEKGADVSYYDPFVPDLREEGMDMISVELTPEAISSTDAIVITTDHAGTDWGLILENAKLVIDTRNATRGMKGKARVIKI